MAFGRGETLICAVLTGAVLALGGTAALAQQPKGKPAAPAPAAPANQAAPTVQRSETMMFGSWRVTCTETDVSKRKSCSAVLNGQDQSGRTVLTWVIGRNNEGALVTVLQTPQTQLGLHIQKGVELKLGNGSARKLDYMVCNQARCESIMTMDDAMAKELMASSIAAVTIYRQDGQPITINLPSIGGADKALNAIGRG